MDPSKMNKPYVTKESAAQLALKIYGLKVMSINEMVSFDDKNFHIKVMDDHHNPYIKDIAPDGYTLKVTNTVKSAIPGHFESMHSAMKYLHQKGLRLPQPVTNMEGKTWTIEEVPILTKNREERIVTGLCGVHLLTFLPGCPVSTLTYTKDILCQWGALLARFHNALVDFSNEILDNKQIFWDLTHVPEIEKFIDCLDEEKTKLVLSVLRNFPDEMDKSLPLVRTGYIHGDFNENNILVRELNHSFQVDGILDLEDMHYGTYVWDVALMLAYVSLDCNDMDPIEGMGYALHGYLQLRTLSDTELSLLKICIASRLCQSLVLGAYSYKQDPTNSYLIISARTGWSRLRQVWETPNDILLRKWKSLQRN